MVGIKPVTPGTIVVLAGTVLLVLVSVSVPLLDSIYFLQATVSDSGISGTVKLGTWGYCVDSTCSNATLGYDLDFDSLFGVSGLAASTGLSNTLIKWLTYVLVLHPIAAGFGGLATLFGILAHIREFALAGLAVWFAGFSATFALLAFIFDVIVFVIAEKRLNSSSIKASASLGNAVWMTLAGWILMFISSCFFGVGRKVLNRRGHEKEASNRMRPQPDAEYGNQMRTSAVGGGATYGQGPMYEKTSSNSNNRYGDSLPAFQDRDGEIVPLTSVRPDSDEGEEEEPRPSFARQPSVPRTDDGSMISGVGEGYGRRPPGMPISLGDGSPATTPGTPGGRGAGAAAGLAAASAAQRGYQHSQQQSTVQPFVSMNGPPQSVRDSTGAAAGTTSSPYGRINTSQGDIATAYGNSATRMPSPTFSTGAYSLANPSTPHQDNFYSQAPPVPPLPANVRSPFAQAAYNEKQHYLAGGSYDNTPSGSNFATPSNYATPPTTAPPQADPSYFPPQPSMQDHQSGYSYPTAAPSYHTPEASLNEGYGHQQDNTIVYHNQQSSQGHGQSGQQRNEWGY